MFVRLCLLQMGNQRIFLVFLTMRQPDFRIFMPTGCSSPVQSAYLRKLPSLLRSFAEPGLLLSRSLTVIASG